MTGLKPFVILTFCFMLNHVSVSANDIEPDVRLDFAVIKKLEERIGDLEEKVEIQSKINLEQNNRIRQLNGKIKSLESELVNFKSNQDQIDSEKQSSSRNHASASVSNQTKTVQALHTHAKAGVSSLRRGVRQSEIVAFTAYLDHNLSHLGIDHPVVYNKIILNEGSAYNNNTGVFTCPFDGIYIFNFMVSTVSVQQIVAKLVVDSVNQVDGIADTFHVNHEAQGGNYVILSLTKGQSVWVANYRWTDQGDTSSEPYRFSTFSGHLMI